MLAVIAQAAPGAAYCQSFPGRQPQPARHVPPVHASPISQAGLTHQTPAPPVHRPSDERQPAQQPQRDSVATFAEQTAIVQDAMPVNPLRAARPRAKHSNLAETQHHGTGPTYAVRQVQAQLPIDDPFDDWREYHERDVQSVLEPPIESLAPPANWRAAPASNQATFPNSAARIPTASHPATRGLQSNRSSSAGQSIPAVRRRQQQPRGTMLDMDCDEIRQVLLDDPITEIDINISPRRDEELPTGLGPAPRRTWQDRFGRPLATGTFVELQRGYAIIDVGNGRLQSLPVAELGEPDLAAIARYWRIPVECTLGDPPRVARMWVPQTVTWKASALCHKPLYFEDIQLERHGHDAGPLMQPLRSTAHFFTRVVFLPYQQGINPPNECQYALGHYRPGNCAPWLVDPIPFSWRGAASQTASYLGGTYLIGQ